MTEKEPPKPPESDEPIDFEETRRRKQNQARRSGLGTDIENDRSVYPEERIETTMTEALQMAQEIVSSTTFERLPIASQTILADQREEARLTKTESIVGIFDSHKKNPKHFDPARMLAMSEELMMRLILKPSSDEDTFEFPKEKLEITQDEALEIAKEVVEKSKELSLDSSVLESRRNWARLFDIPSLLITFNAYKKDPTFHPKETILATAEELLKRLGPNFKSEK